MGEHVVDTRNVAFSSEVFFLFFFFRFCNLQITLCLHDNIYCPLSHTTSEVVGGGGAGKETRI